MYLYYEHGNEVANRNVGTEVRKLVLFKCPATLIRHAGTPQERKWDTQIAGDFARLALFSVEARPETGDEIHCESFAEPHVITGIAPVLSHGSGVLYLRANIAPRSRWNRPRAIVQPQLVQRGEKSISDPSGETRVKSSSARKAKSGRRNPNYEMIDKALREIDQARPRNQQEVFRMLDSRHIPLPLAAPFRGGKGWLVAFQKDEHAARVWLSKAWSRLSLRSFTPRPS